MAKHEEKVIVIGFNDEDDGEDAYFASSVCVEMPDCFTAALKALTKHDHVCIVEIDTYVALAHESFNTYAPYSIIIEVGAYARTD